MRVISRTTSGINLQLKYCECCSALWLRRQQSNLTLCPSCRRAEDDLAAGSSFLAAWTRLRAEAHS